MSGRVLAVVPARGGSKGLPGKNLRPLAGTPLIGHTIRCARLVPEVTRVVVSTDDATIAAVAEELGGEVPFLRPAELADDRAPMADVVRHALETVEQAEGSSYDAVLLLDPTSPGRQPADLSQAIAALWATPGVDGVVSVSEPTFSPTWVGVRTDSDGVMSRYFPEAAGVTRRQDVAARYLRVNGSFYVWRADFVRRLGPSWLDSGRFLAAEIPESRAFSIDDEYEFRLVEALVAAGLLVLPAEEARP